MDEMKWRQRWNAASFRQRMTYLASLQTSRRQGIYLNLALMKKPGRLADWQYRSVLSPLRTHDGLAVLLRRFSCLEDSKGLIRRDCISNISERG